MPEDYYNFSSEGSQLLSRTVTAHSPETTRPDHYSACNQRHFSVLSTHHTRPMDMQHFHHQLQQRDARLTDLESRLHEKVVTIARLELSLEHAKAETQAALKVVISLSGCANGAPNQTSAGAITDRRIGDLQRDVERLQFDQRGGGQKQNGDQQASSSAKSLEGGPNELPEISKTANSSLRTLSGSTPYNDVPSSDVPSSDAQERHDFLSAQQSSLEVKVSALCDTTHVEKNEKSKQEESLIDLGEALEGLNSHVSLMNSFSTLVTRPENKVNGLGNELTRSTERIQAACPALKQAKAKFISYFPEEEREQEQSQIVNPATPPEPAADSFQHLEDDQPEWVLVQDNNVPEDLDSHELYRKLECPYEMHPVLQRSARVFDSSDSSFPPHTSGEYARYPRGPRALNLPSDEWMLQNAGRFPLRSAGLGGSRFARELCPQYFEHGIAYAPKDGEVDVYRTVVVDNLPADIKLDQIVEFAKDHPIVSSQLLDTSKFRFPRGGEKEVLGTVVVRLEFYFQSSAEQFAFDFSNANLSFGELEPRITHLISSPTYPLPSAIKANREVRGNERKWTRRIQFHQPMVAAAYFLDALEGFSKGFRANGWILAPPKLLLNGDLEITCNSIKTAVYVFERLSRAKEFEGCFPRFVRDYGSDDQPEFVAADSEAEKRLKQLNEVETSIEEMIRSRSEKAASSGGIVSSSAENQSSEDEKPVSDNEEPFVQPIAHGFESPRGCGPEMITTPELGY